MAQAQVVSIHEFFLILARLSPAMISTMGPFRYLPTFVRVVLLLVFTAIFMAYNQTPVAVESGLLKMYVAELIFGFGVLWVFVAAYGTVLFFGRLIDLQIGFGAAGVIDPGNQTQEALIGTAYLALISTLFFILGFHRELFMFWWHSFALIPLGSADNWFWLNKVVPFLTSCFVLALLLFAPVILIIWCVDVATGAVSKAMPQMNIYFVMLPFKIAIGLIVLAAMIKSSGESIRRIFELMFQQLHGMVS